MKYQTMIAMLIAASVGVPSLLKGNDDQQLEQVSLTKDGKKKGPASVKGFQDSRGHFSFSTRMNGVRVKVMVDTGATSVAINARTAKKIKARGRGSVRVSTANGVITVKKTTIKEIRIGGIVVKNVKATILPNEALGGTLLGMSFLRKLKRFEISGRTLTLTR